jgi:hypothetical protein
VVVNLALVIGLASLSWLILPAICDRGTGIRDTLSAIADLARRVPIRIITYRCVAGLLAAMATFSAWLFVLGAVGITFPVLAVGMGSSKLTALLAGLGGLGSLLPGRDLFPSFGLPAQALAAADLGPTGQLLKLALAAIALLLLAIPLVLSICLACAVYLRVRDEAAGG